MLSLSNLALRQFPSGLAVAWRGGECFTYAQFVHDVGKLCRHLPSCDAVSLFCRDSYQFTVALYAVLHSGARAVLPADQQTASQAAGDTAGLFVDDEYVCGVLSRPGRGELGFLDAEAAYIDFFTSGSTGEPKKVTRSLGLFEREITTLHALLGCRSQRTRFLATVPHHHVYGITFKIFLALGTGGSFSCDTLLHWEDVRKEVKDGDFLICSPAHLNRLGGLEPFSSSRSPACIVSAGAPLSVEASCESRHVLGEYPVEIFGSTETGAVASRVQAASREPWRPLSGISLRQDCGGQLEILSPFVGDEWFAMSDVVRFEGEGFQHLGRADKIVKIEGKRVSLVRMVSEIERLPGVQEAVVVVLDNPTRLGAAIVLTPEGEKELALRGRFLTGRIFRRELAKTNDAAGIPKHWRFVESFPVQSMGKYCLTEITSWFTTT